MMKQYGTVFSDKGGPIASFKAHIHVTENARPVFFQGKSRDRTEAITGGQA